jgi:copper homeostasis protein
VPVLIEVAVDSVADAIAAQQAGAGRIELCANLREGGLTPSIGLVRSALAHVSVPVFVMVRPRNGDCVYSAADIEVMLRDIEAAKHAGAHGIVSGAMNANGTIDEEGTEALIEAASPLPFTFHKAFDQTRNLDESLDTCLALGVGRILTSGGHRTALEGADVLARLQGRAAPHALIVAGGGVRAEHAATLVSSARVSELHLGPRRAVRSTMVTRPGMISISKADAGLDWEELDEAGVREIASATRTS